MKRLLHVISFTTDLESSVQFYREGLGLSLGAHSQYMADFSTGGTGLVVLAVHEAQKREVELCFESYDVHAAVDRLRERGVRFIDELRTLAFGSVIHFRDPEGNLLSLLQPGQGERDDPRREEREAEAGGGVRATAVAVAASGAPILSTAIVNVGDLTAARAYYGHLLALTESVDSPAWVQYDTGAVRLALHSRRDRNAVDLHHTQPVSFGFTVERLEDWVEDARARGIELLSAPSDEGFGLTAEIVDPEGNIVVVREPISEDTLEERLAAAWEEDDTPARAAIRSPARNAEHHTSWVAQKPDYKPGRKSARGKVDEAAGADADAMPASDDASPGRTAPDAARRKPKTRPDAKRARAKLDDTGRLKKIEGRTTGAKKRATASGSKSVPVKRAAAKKGATKKRGGR